MERSEWDESSNVEEKPRASEWTKKKKKKGEGEGDCKLYDKKA